MFDEIVTHIKKHVSLTVEETELLLASVKVKELKRKNICLKQGRFAMIIIL